MPVWIPLIVALLPFDVPSAAPETMVASTVAPAIAGYCQLTPTASPGLSLPDRSEATAPSTLAVASSNLPNSAISLSNGQRSPYAVPAIKMLPDSYGLGAMRPAIELWRADDGLFYVTGFINGQAIRFLVDTGASTITLTADDAARVGAKKTNEAPWVANTANGRRSMQRVNLNKMVVGTTNAVDVPAAVAPDGLGVSLLGANWLTHVSSVMIEGDRMVIR